MFRLEMSVAAGLALVLAASPSLAQSSSFATTPRPLARVSFFVWTSQWQSPGQPSASSQELQTSVTYQTPELEGEGMDVGVDVRHTRYSVEGRDPRLAIYDGFIGARLAGGSLRVKAGHMWLNDLGSLGSVAGGLVEYRTAPQTANRVRVGVFGGLEPNTFRLGYAEGVKKAGTYVSIDGARSRRHVAGFVTVRNGGLTERSVLTFTNYLPVGRSLFVYQAGEIDVRAPVGTAQGGLAYLFTSARVNAGRRVELMGTHNRGRSLDVRGLAEDVLSGRPVAQRQIDGLQYESLGGRISVEVVPRVRVYTGYSRDKNNRDDAPTGRWLIGGHAADVFHSGVDVTASDSRLERSNGSYHAFYASVGRQIGRAVYASGSYSTSLSIVRFARTDGLIIETKPSSTRVGGQASINLGRSVSLLVDVERTTDDDTHEFRALSGLTYRFR
ncbi:MAG: hypothetical protein AB7I50_13035 [Vicinamibacterales bacterium]